MEFQGNFDTLSILPEVSSADLKRLGSEYQARRITLRNDLLRLQDELRAQLTADEFVRIGEEYDETVMTPLDAAFARLLNEVLRIRQSLLDTLSPKEWDKVFD